jgi:predicted kinase
VLARQIAAAYLRIDSIEQSLCDAGAVSHPINDAGYRVSYAIAEDNLRVGRTVIADSVNPLAVTRDAWLAVADRAQVKATEIEIICSDQLEHRRRVETRFTDISGLRLPAWSDVISRDYDRWTREHLIVDTAGRSIEESANIIRESLE